MLKRRKPPRSGIVRNPDRVRSPAHRAWVRGFECACRATGFTNCYGPIECAHVRIGTDGGTGIKPSDEWTIPLCAAHHRLLHSDGEPRFAAAHGLNLKAIAERLAAQSPALRRLAHMQRTSEGAI